MNKLIMISMLMGWRNKVMKLKDKSLTLKQQIKLNKQLIEVSRNGNLVVINTLIAGANANSYGLTALIRAA